MRQSLRSQALPWAAACQAAELLWMHAPWRKELVTAEGLRQTRAKLGTDSEVGRAHSDIQSCTPWAGALERGVCTVMRKLAPSWTGECGEAG